MDVRIVDLPFDAAALHRLSPGRVTRHPQGNAIGAVKRLDAIRAPLAMTASATGPGFQFNGLEHEALIGTDSMLHERCIAIRLRAAGLDARHLRGGIDGWQAAGRPVVDEHAPETP